MQRHLNRSCQAKGHRNIAGVTHALREQTHGFEAAHFPLMRAANFWTQSCLRMHSHTIHQKDHSAVPIIKLWFPSPADGWLQAQVPIILCSHNADVSNQPLSGFPYGLTGTIRGLQATVRRPPASRTNLLVMWVAYAERRRNETRVRTICYRTRTFTTIDVGVLGCDTVRSRC